MWVLYNSVITLKWSLYQKTSGVLFLSRSLRKKYLRTNVLKMYTACKKASIAIDIHTYMYILLD